MPKPLNLHATKQLTQPGCDKATDIGLCHFQALQTDWIVTKGGKMPRPLNPDVARGAANVAAARRLRNMVHGAVAMDPGSPGNSQRGVEEHMQEYRKRHMAQGQRGQETLGYRYTVFLPEANNW